MFIYSPEKQAETDEQAAENQAIITKYQKVSENFIFLALHVLCVTLGSC